LNHKKLSQTDVEDHIHVHGFCRSYTCWIHHGEDTDDEDDQTPVHGLEGSDDGNDQAPVHGLEDTDDGNNQAPVHDGEDDPDLPGSERGVQGLIEDLYNAAKHGISGNLYQQLMEEAKRELYPGSTEESRLTFIIKLLHIKVYNRITNSGFDAILELLSTSFPNVTGPPKSYRETKAILRRIGFGYVSIHVCK
jgi:hypothetical protein